MKNSDIPWNEPPARFKAFMHLMVNGKDQSIRSLADQWGMSKSGAQKIIDEWTKRGQNRVRITQVKTSKIEKQNGQNGVRKVDTPIHPETPKIFITRDEFNTLVASFGRNAAEMKIRHMNNYLVNHPRKKYANHFTILQEWIERDGLNGKTTVADSRESEALNVFASINGRR